ncbi:MAG: inositol monophosphatase family protein [Mariprofundus sp.]
MLEEAGKQIILPAWKTLSSVHTKSDGSIITEIDLACESFIQKSLAEIDGKIGFLSEEMEPEEQRGCLNKGGNYWCLDPLDGTTNFVANYPVFSISLALIEDGRPIMGVIHDPVREESFYAQSHKGAWLNGMPLQTSDEKNLKASVGFVDFKRLNPSLAAALATTRLYRSQRNIGSCALEWSWLAAGRAQFILHGGQQLWDYAAGLLIAEEAGCVVSNFEKKHPFEKNQLKSSMAAACNNSIHKQVLSLI